MELKRHWDLKIDINGNTWVKLPLKELESIATPWTRITSDPGTLPPDDTLVLFSVKSTMFPEREPEVMPGYCINYSGCPTPVCEDIQGREIEGHVYKWQPLPDPAPYEVEDER